MFERDESLALLARTPSALPEFRPDLDGVARRARSHHARRMAVQGAIGSAVAAGVLVPVLILGGLLGGSSGRPMDGVGGNPQKLIRWFEPSESMDPTIKVGQTVLVDTNAYRFGRYPQTGDLVLLKVTVQGQEFEMVKRVIGLPGQVIDIRGGAVFVDGRPLAEPYLNAHRDTADYGPFTVAPGKVFVAGDNRINSNDSRFYLGQIPFAALLGKVVGRSTEAGAPPTAGTAPAAGTVRP